MDRDLQESNDNSLYETSTKINNVLKQNVKPPCKWSPLKTCLNVTISFTISHSLSGSIRSSLHSELQLIPSGRSILTFRPAEMWARSHSRRRQSRRVLAGFSSRYLILEDHAEQLPSQPVGQPWVLDDGHLEALAAEHGIVVGVDGPSHSLNDHQVGLPLPHHHR